MFLCYKIVDCDRSGWILSEKNRIGSDLDRIQIQMEICGSGSDLDPIFLLWIGSDLTPKKSERSTSLKLCMTNGFSKTSSAFYKAVFVQLLVRPSRHIRDIGFQSFQCKLCALLNSLECQTFIFNPSMIVHYSL